MRRLLLISTVALATFVIHAEPWQTPRTDLMALVNNGEAVGCVSTTSSAAASVTLSMQTNATPFDSTGADLLIAVGARVAMTHTITDNKGNAWTNIAETFGNREDYPNVGLSYSHPTTTGAGHTFTMTMPASQSVPSFCVMAWKGSDLGPPLEGTVQPYSPGTLNITLDRPLEINRTALVITGLGSFEIISAAPVGYTTLPFITNTPVRTGFGLAWTFGNLGLENPLWRVANTGRHSMNAAVFLPLPPALTITQQPTTTISGQVIGPPVAGTMTGTMATSAPQGGGQRR